MAASGGRRRRKVVVSTPACPNDSIEGCRALQRGEGRPQPADDASGQTRRLSLGASSRGPDRTVYVARRFAVVAAAGVALIAIALVARSWWDSRLPGTYSVMQYGSSDYGDAAPTGIASAAGARVVSVKDLAGATDGVPDDRFTLTAEHARVRLASGETVDALTFNGQVPGPELRVRTRRPRRGRPQEQGRERGSHDPLARCRRARCRGWRRRCDTRRRPCRRPLRLPIQGQTDRHLLVPHAPGLGRRRSARPLRSVRDRAARGTADPPAGPDADRAHARRRTSAECGRPGPRAGDPTRHPRAIASGEFERHERELRAAWDAVRGPRDRRDQT